MVHDCNTREKKQELAKMNRDSQMKEMENNILSTNPLKDEILNLKEIVIKTSKMRMKNFDKKCARLERRCAKFLKAVLWLSSISIVLCISTVFRYIFSTFFYFR